ncbi:MAG: HNH endonuclease, partial [Oxalobacteraceae bacterium]
TCAISGMRLVSNRDAQMIDACHIVPFAESQDDTISNGLSLCPNLHRAFDRHLISISPDYEVIVSEHFIEESVDYSIRKYHGRKILLPTETNYLPSTHNLAWHHERFWHHTRFR